MKVIEPRQKPTEVSRSRTFVANLLADDFEVRDRIDRVERVEIDLPEAETGPIPATSPKQQEPTKAAPSSQPARLVSLDAFRGLTVVLMLIVNNIALDKYTPDMFTHGAWNQGLRLADYVFPWFLLCVGLAIPFSFASFKKKGLPSWRHDIKIVGRAVGLVALGCLVNAAISRQVVFTLGVLQLIGLSYLVAAFAYELPIVRRTIIAVIMLAGYGMAIKCLPFPGAHAGTFLENSNLIDHINRTYLVIYNLDGLLSVIPTAALMILSTLVGDALINRKLNPLRRLTAMAVVGAVMAVAGVCSNTFIPYNKPVWTPSYLLLTGGVGLLLLAAIYLFTDAIRWTKWPFPLLVLGSNAILAYVLPVLCKVMVFSTWAVYTAAGKMSLQEACLNSLVDRLGRVSGGWTYTWLYICSWWLILFVLYRKRAFVRI